MYLAPGTAFPCLPCPILFDYILNTFCWSDSNIIRLQSERDGGEKWGGGGGGGGAAFQKPLYLYQYYNLLNSVLQNVASVGVNIHTRHYSKHHTLLPT